MFTKPKCYEICQIKCESSCFSSTVGFVSNVLALLSSGRMFDRKWNWPESLAGFRQPLPVPTHANPCQFTAQPRPPWEKQRKPSSGKMQNGPSLPLPCPPPTPHRKKIKKQFNASYISAGSNSVAVFCKSSLQDMDTAKELGSDDTESL